MLTSELAPTLLSTFFKRNQIHVQLYFKSNYFYQQVKNFTVGPVCKSEVAACSVWNAVLSYSNKVAVLYMEQPGS